jgi:hypothetical protein
MITPPTSLVLTPHELWYTCCVFWFSSKKVVSNALLKFCPRLWLVPACSTEINDNAISIPRATLLSRAATFAIQMAFKTEPRDS